MLSRFLTSSFIAILAAVALSAPTATWASVGAPTNLTLRGGSPTEDATPTFSWSAVSGAYWYDYQIDSRVYDAISSSLTVTLAPLSEGHHTFRVRAHNYAGDVSSVTSMNFEIDRDYDNDEDEDEDEFVVPNVIPSSATEDESVTIKVTPYGDLDAEDCDLYVDGDYKGNMSQSGDTFQKSYTFSNDGTYSVYARCTNEDGDEVKGSTRTVTVYEEDESEDEDFVVPSVTPSSATEDEAVTIKVTPYGDLDADDCNLYVNGSNKGSMSQSGSTFQKSYTFTNDGSYTVYARCSDENGHEVSGSSRTITVYAEDDHDIDTNDAREGELIKTHCSAGAGVNDPCKAVYYWGEDGLRHAFPNEDVFYSWYEDFDNVIEISTSDMSDLRIGHNVTIKPGTSVVKFATSDDVYAVSEGGILHHYLTTSLLVGDYGSDWSTRDLVVISDVFFGNYTIGSVIDSSADYDPEETMDMVASIDDNF